jgi:hypothetical protein
VPAPSGAAPEQTTPNTKPESDKGIDFATLPAPVRLGLRVEFIKQNTPVAPLVVIVSDAPSYLAAIGAWKQAIRFPVLIDDGTLASREDIARFVRGFLSMHEGAQVVRWKSPEVRPDAPAAKDGGLLVATEGQVRGALASSVGVPADIGVARDAATNEILRGVPSPGLVVTSEGDPAWTGALALAAGHVQPLVFVKVEGDVAGVMTVKAADDLCAAIEDGVEKTGMKWKALGDAIDAVTLCLNCPVKFAVTEHDEHALTDRVGRLGAGATASERWAWAGQIFGTSAHSTYDAMCALFLAPRTAWIFDGYPNSSPWNQWSGRKAADAFTQAGVAPTLDARPDNGVRDWRARAAKPIDNGLVLVNSKGNSDFFELEPGLGRPCDAPILNRPVMVNFVHSWSAQWPARRDTVAGRWLERGAYSYVGSVREPFLQAFVPTPAVAGRFSNMGIWGACVRLDDSPMWKIAVFGDPLITFGHTYKLAEVAAVEKLKETTLKGLTIVGESISDEAKSGKFLGVVRDLNQLGRDDKVKTLVLALLRERPEAVTPEVAAESVLPVFRAGGSYSEVIAVYERVSPELESNPGIGPAIRDAVWLSVFPNINKCDEKAFNLLRRAIRPDIAERDGTELGQAITRKRSKADAIAVLTLAKDETKDPQAKIGLDKAIAAVNALHGR